MDKDTSQDPISIANASGFPLQIAVAHIINRSSFWRVILEEHPWHLKDIKSEGYIDIVAEDYRNKFEVMVIECKRVKQSAWNFLIPNISPKVRSHAIFFGAWRSDSNWKKFEWEGWQADPASYESQKCAIPGQEHGRKNLLERVASELIESVEALAFQEKIIQQQNAINNFSRAYIPVIVTTAHLYASFFDPATITIQDGSLPKTTTYKEVPFVRFRKSLIIPNGYLSAGSIQDVYKLSERTIFIVNADNLLSFLNEFEAREPRLGEVR